MGTDRCAVRVVAVASRVVCVRALGRCVGGTVTTVVIASCGSSPGGAPPANPGQASASTSTSTSNAAATVPRGDGGSNASSASFGTAGSSESIGSAPSSPASGAPDAAGETGSSSLDGGPSLSISNDASQSDASSSSGGSPSSGSSPTASAAGAVDGGAACPSLTGAADRAYARWPVPNPPTAGLPNPFRYHDPGDGTILDGVTGLAWQKTVTASQFYTWSDAHAYCAGLTLAGRVWHLPSRIELLSLQDYTSGLGMAAIFSPPGGKYTWTSTAWVVSQITTKPQDAWMVNFGGGGGLTSNAAAQTSAQYTRCASGPIGIPLPYPHYVQIAAGEVEDVETQLVWAQTSSLTAVAQPAALSLCAAFGLHGHAWRLPSLNELSSLVDDNPDIKKVSPAVDQCVFADTSPNQYYMSSSALSTSSAPQPWAINYADGFTNHTQTMGFVRCVR